MFATRFDEVLNVFLKEIELIDFFSTTFRHLSSTFIKNLKMKAFIKMSPPYPNVTR